LRIQVELADGLQAEQCAELPEAISRALRQQLSFRAELELVLYKTIPRTEGKAKRVQRSY
jgi:phenylacetate-coenzyme A ligase PaaK-like adenylate-forming protein